MMIKKTRITAIALALTGVLAMGAGAAAVQQITASLRPDITLVVDGTTQAMLSADGGAIYPVSYNGTTYLPIRAVAEALGKTVTWDAKTNTVTLTTADTGTGATTKTEVSGDVKSYESSIAAFERRMDALDKSWTVQDSLILERDIDKLDDQLDAAYRNGKLTRDQYRTLENRLDKVDERLDNLDDQHDDDWDDQHDDDWDD